MANWRHLARVHGIPAGEIARMASAFEHDDIELGATALLPERSAPFSLPWVGPSCRVLPEFDLDAGYRL